jgi:peptidoglycan/LPS O-acetylase OafA/YrhL
VFCACNLKERFFSLNKRRPSALHALDGLRAVAILWVFCLHSAMLFCNEVFLPPFIKEYTFMVWITNGDIGVDIFFVLSGFLIGFILLKEADKYDGNIDYFNFIRSRTIRLWFTMLPYCLSCITYLPLGYWLPVLFFVGNLFGG